MDVTTYRIMRLLSGVQKQAETGRRGMLKHDFVSIIVIFTAFVVNEKEEVS